MLKKDPNGCPHLQLAPMEGVGDRTFRKAMASVGGFDEAVRDFIRVPRCGHVKSLAKEYDRGELSPIPLAAQIMGSEPELMAAMAVELELRGAPRIDVNCGCPSNMVTGKGAGSSLLKEPSHLNKVVRAVVKAVSIPVTMKMRSGYDDISLFQENLLAGQESGVSYITLHPRTKADGYGPPARWDLIATAKSLLKIPLVGNGDIRTVQDAIDMLGVTRCDGLMIGRGSIMNPFLFQEIRARFSKTPFAPKWEELLRYLTLYVEEMSPASSAKQQVGKMKQLLSFYCKGSSLLMGKRQTILSSEIGDLPTFFAYVQPMLKESFATHST